MKKFWSQGWSMTGCVPVHGAPRNCAQWSTQEERDLLVGWRRGDSIIELSVRHGRLTNAIELRLMRLFDSDQLPSRMAARPIRTNEDRGPTWTSKDGRVTQVHLMDLDHMLNVVHDCNFRVALMRRGFERSIGETNPNASPATLAAFAHVRSSDVFPALPAIRTHAGHAFFDRFAVTLSDVKQTIIKAWQHGVRPDELYRDAIRFVLNADRVSKHARLAAYVCAFKIDSDETFRKMCWNLRIDQPACWTFINQQSMLLQRIAKVPFNRLNSALKFVEPKVATNEWADFDF